MKLTPPSRLAPLDDDTVDIMAVTRTLWRGKLTIFSCIGALVLAAAIYLWGIATPVFRANSVVMLESREASFVGLKSILGNLATQDTPVVNTEVEVLRGRNLMGRVAERLDLATVAEFNPGLRPAGLVARLRQTLVGTEPAPNPQGQALKDLVVTNLLKRVSISNVPSSLVFTITAASTSPQRAAQIADTIAALYIEDQLRYRFEATQAAVSWLTDQVATLKVAFETAEGKMRLFQNESDLIDEKTLAAMERQLKETRRRAAQLAEQILATDGVLHRLSESHGPQEQAQAVGNAQLQDLAATMDPSDTEMLMKFQTALASLKAQLEADRDRAAAQIRALDAASASLTKDINQQSDELTRLDQLRRDAEAGRLIYEHFETRLKEITAQQGIHQADSRVLSNAVVPTVPAAPRKGLVLGLMVFLGLCLGACVVLLREASRRLIRSSQELEALTGLAVLAQVPRVTGRARRDVLSYFRQNPTSAPAESIRDLRASVLLASGGAPPKVIVLTSSVPAEGKSTLTLAFAQNLTTMGRKVLVIEGDIRAKRMNDLVPNGALRRSGVLDVLMERVALEEAVVPVAGVGDMLLGGTISAQSVDLFSSEAFNRLLAAARASYDIVLIDTPPVLAVPDARVIAQGADAVIYVVRWDKTTRAQVTEGLRRLTQVRARVAGLVLSQIDLKGMRSYGYGEIYGAYYEGDGQRRKARGG